MCKWCAMALHNDDYLPKNDEFRSKFKTQRQSHFPRWRPFFYLPFLLLFPFRSASQAQLYLWLQNLADPVSLPPCRLAWTCLHPMHELWTTTCSLWCFPDMQMRWPKNKNWVLQAKRLDNLASNIAILSKQSFCQHLIFLNRAKYYIIVNIIPKHTPCTRIDFTQNGGLF